MIERGRTLYILIPTDSMLRINRHDPIAMPWVALAVRNVFVHDATSDAVVAGCRQFGSTTIAEFFCLNFIFTNPVQGNFRLFHRETATYVTPTSPGLLQLGNYAVASMGTFPSESVSLTRMHRRAGNVLGRRSDYRRCAPAYRLWRHT